MTQRRLIATIRHGRLETTEPLALPEGYQVELELRGPNGAVEERRLLLAELHELMQSNPFFGTDAVPPRLDWEPGD